jgi:hypothetical protein
MKKTQFDYQQRIVALNNLEAMCKRISGTCHTFKIAKVWANRVHVEYSNPDEYGSPEPITAVYPCYKQHDNAAVVLDAVNYLGCTGKNEEAWQAFAQLTDCEKLFRSQVDTDTWKWKTEYEILIKHYPEYTVSNKWFSGGSIQKWYCQGREFSSWREAQDWAVEQMCEHYRKLLNPSQNNQP